jgi:hypothetical protein
MTRTPTTSLTKLYSLRGRERLFLGLWGLTRWLAFALTLLTIAMLADWWIDKYRETPMWVRIPLTLLQVIGIAVAALVWVIWPWAKGPSLIPLAKRVEETIPEFDHRLITAIQLTRSGAKTEGMSNELIGIVTDEAELISGKHNLARLADTKRLKWSAALLAWPLGITAFLLIFFGPTLLVILLKRQALADVEIPRNIRLEKYQMPKVWPAGDEVTIRYKVTAADGRIEEKMKGKLIVAVDNQPDAEYDLAYESAAGDGQAIFSSTIPHSSMNFKYRARLGDGRTRGWDEVVFEPRPAVTIYGAWVAMPVYVPRKPDGSRYESEQNNGDIKGYNGARARVRIHVQKPVSDAKLILFSEGDTEAGRVPMLLLDPEKAEDGSMRYPAEASFDLRAGTPKLVAYRVEVTDNFGFMNVRRPITSTRTRKADGTVKITTDFDPEEHPRRSITITEPEPPYVHLLPERFPVPGLNIMEEDVLEGMPIPLGGSIPIEYLCRSPIGFKEPKPGTENRLIAPTRLVYRVNEGDWNYLPLDEIPQTAQTGEWNVLRASFENTAHQKNVLKDRVEFHAKPSPNPGYYPPRREGGGRFDFETAKLKKKGMDGKEAELEIGDKVEFYIEVTDCDPALNHPPGRSEPRIKELRTLEEVIRRGIETVNSESRIRDLEKRQQGVFARPKN